MLLLFHPLLFLDWTFSPPFLWTFFQPLPFEFCHMRLRLPRFRDRGRDTALPWHGLYTDRLSFLRERKPTAVRSNLGALGVQIAAASPGSLR